jgi:hypothetical protein
MRISLAIVVSMSAVACSPVGSAGRSLDPARVIVAPSVWPTPQTAPPDAPPRIIALWMNDATIHPGRRWMGKIITSTNVASVEIRTESFSFTADHRGPGLFDFSQDILDIIPQYRRRYILRFIARNTPGEADERTVPITIR